MFIVACVRILLVKTILLSGNSSLLNFVLMIKEIACISPRRDAEQQMSQLSNVLGVGAVTIEKVAFLNELTNLAVALAIVVT